MSLHSGRQNITHISTHSVFITFPFHYLNLTGLYFDQTGKYLHTTWFVVIDLWILVNKVDSAARLWCHVRMTICPPLQWRHNGRYGVSNHQPHDCLLTILFRRRSKKTSKIRVNGLCERNSPVTGEFPAQRVSNAENVSIWWRHHVAKNMLFPAPPSLPRTGIIKGDSICFSANWIRKGIKVYVCCGYILNWRWLLYTWC